MGHVDRKKHDWDVMERVFGGLRTEDAGPRSRTTSMDARPWIGGLASSIVQVTVNAMPEHQHPSEPRNDHQENDRRREYESDRRGEHKYPHEDDRPSQRERDELKERLERGS